MIVFGHGIADLAALAVRIRFGVLHPRGWSEEEQQLSWRLVHKQSLMSCAVSFRFVRRCQGQLMGVLLALPKFSLLCTVLRNRVIMRVFHLVLPLREACMGARPQR